MRAKLKAVLIAVAGAIAMMATNVEAADTVKIGMVAPLTGPGAFSGQLQSQGFKLAVDEVNKAGGILGRQIEAAIEDDQTTNPGAVLAFSKLAGDKDIVAFIGPIRSTQIHAMAPDVLKLGKPVMIGGTDPTLTHMDNLSMANS
jgi:branched-chain amino acid transport system substrate-binding protein